MILLYLFRCSYAMLQIFGLYYKYTETPPREPPKQPQFSPGTIGAMTTETTRHTAQINQSNGYNCTGIDRKTINHFKTNDSVCKVREANRTTRKNSINIKAYKTGVKTYQATEIEFYNLYEVLEIEEIEEIEDDHMCNIYNVTIGKPDTDVFEKETNIKAKAKRLHEKKALNVML